MRGQVLRISLFSQHILTVAPSSGATRHLLPGGEKKRGIRSTGNSLSFTGANNHRPHIPRTFGSLTTIVVSAVIAQTSASSLSGERPDERPSGPKSVIWSSSFSNRAA
jgi:hypothetical protein